MLFESGDGVLNLGYLWQKECALLLVALGLFDCLEVFVEEQCGDGGDEEK